MTLFMPSVMTIGEIFSLATPTPLTNPAPIPTASAAARPAQRCAVVALRHASEDDAGARDGPGDGEIDAAGEDHHRLANRGDAEIGGKREQHQDVR